MSVARLPAVAACRLVMHHRFTVVLTALSSIAIALFRSCLSTCVACWNLDSIVTSCNERQPSLLRIATLSRLRRGQSYVANTGLSVVTQMIVQASYTTGPCVHLLIQLFLVANILSHVLGVTQTALAVRAQRCLSTLPHNILQK